MAPPLIDNDYQHLALEGFSTAALDILFLQVPVRMPLDYLSSRPGLFDPYASCDA